MVQNNCASCENSLKEKVPRCPDANPPIRTLFLRHRRIFCHHMQTLRPLPAEQHTNYSLSFYDPLHPILPAAPVSKDERKKSALSTRCHYFLLLFLPLSFDAQSIITPPLARSTYVFSPHTFLLRSTSPLSVLLCFS